MIMLSWYKDRLARARRGQAGRWMVLEMVCMTLSLATAAALVAAAAVRWTTGQVLLDQWRWVLELLVAGSVGYLTNLIAITMLFRPYDADDRHPIGLFRWVWPLGLIARNREKLALQAGVQVANRLLTPQAIADEIARLIEGAFEDKELQQKLRRNLGPVIRGKLPQIVEEATPAIMRILRDIFGRSLQREQILAFLEQVVAPWLNERDNKRRFVEGLVAILKEQAPFIRQKLMAYSQTYRSKGTWRRLAMNLAEWTDVINWDEIELSIGEMLESTDTRRKLAETLETALGRLRQAVADSDTETVVRELSGRVSDFVAEWLDRYLKAELPALGDRVADDRRFWRWLAADLMPALKPFLLSWLDREGGELIRDHFDVAGRVQAAIEKMQVREMHQMVNEVSAQHLGAIQVLGFVLGLLAGALLMLG